METYLIGFALGICVVAVIFFMVVAVIGYRKANQSNEDVQSIFREIDTLRNLFARKLSESEEMLKNKIVNLEGRIDNRFTSVSSSMYDINNDLTKLRSIFDSRIDKLNADIERKIENVYREDEDIRNVIERKMEGVYRETEDIRNSIEHNIKDIYDEINGISDKLDKITQTK